MRRLGALTLGVLLVLAGTAAPASAERFRLGDAVGDAAGDESRDVLDIRSATLDNRERVLVARVRFDRVGRGDAIVSVDRRGGAGLRLVSTRRADGSTRDRLLPGAFTDRGDEVVPPGPCPGFSATWDTRRDTVRFRLPARCWNGGDYGDVRFTVLTERRGGDADIAPDRRPASRWVARG